MMSLTYSDVSLDDLAEAYEAERARRSLRRFVASAWHIIEPTNVFTPGWHIDAICEHLEAVTAGEIRNLIINIPPRHMKSLAVSVFWPTWLWIRNPGFRWLFSSYAQSLSTRDSLKCRRLIESPWYQRNWGHVYQLADDQNLKMRFDNDKAGYRIATSVGGSATGEGGDAVVVDDPHNVLETHSDAKRESVLVWWDEVMSTRLNDPHTGAKVIVMQRVHERDLTGHVLERSDYEHLCLPAEYEATTYVTGIGWADPRTESGELLWPERFSQDEIDGLKRDLGSFAVSGQLQQRPSPATGGLIKRAWWQYYGHPPAEFDEVIQSWDMAFKDTKASDYVVGQVWGRLGANTYLLDQVRDRMSFPETLVAFKSLTAKWPQSTAKIVEDKANGSAVIATLKNKIAGIIPYSPEQSKVARVHAVTPQIESGNVWLPNTASFTSDFVEECAKFPMGAYDDQVDAMSQALLRFSGKPRPKVQVRSVKRR